MSDTLKINIKNAITFVFLAVGLVFSTIYWDSLKIFIRKVLECDLLYKLLFGFPILVFLLDAFSKKSTNNTYAIFNLKFNRFFDTVINSLTYATGITSSVTLIKGLFIQSFFSDKIYFTEFNGIDKLLILFTMCFLLYFLMSRICNLLMDLIFNKDVINIDKTNEL